MAFANYYGPKTSLEAEALALLDGLRLCKHHNIFRVWLEVDSLLLVQMLKGASDIPWNLSYIVREIKIFLSPLSVFTHVYREINQGAYLLANWGVEQQRNEIFLDSSSIPHRLKGILRLDKSGLSQLRKK